MLPIPKGAIFTVTSGAYSDYHVRGVFRALEKIDLDHALSEWLQQHPDQSADYHFDDYAFMESLSHLFEQIDAWNWHLCSYNRVNEMEVSEPVKSE